jgi:hypothetical protein
MQALGPRVSTVGTTYSAAAVQAVLTSSTAQEQWRFFRYDQTAAERAEITQYVALGSATVTHDTTRDVHRELVCDIRADAGLNWLSDIIGVHYQVRMPDTGWVDFALGLFVIVTATKTITHGVTWRHVDAFDFGQFLVDAKFTDSYTAPNGASYLYVISQIMIPFLPNGAPAPLIYPPPTQAIPTSLVWDVGVSRLQACNDLLTAVSYNPLWFDELGTPRSEPMQDFTLMAPPFTFDTTLLAGTGNIVLDTINENPDTSNAYNVTTVTVQDPQRATIAVTYTNTNPLSRTSVTNWRVKSQVISDSTISDATAAMARAKAETQAAARIHLLVTLPTFPWPASQNLDLYGATWVSADDGVNFATYVELGWIMNCSEGAVTQHNLSRVVPS